MLRLKRRLWSGFALPPPALQPLILAACRSEFASDIRVPGLKSCFWKALARLLAVEAVS
jgi:hypothetical protein